MFAGKRRSVQYVNATDDLVADLLSDIAAEQRAKVVDEYLHRQIPDLALDEDGMILAGLSPPGSRRSR